MVLREIPASGFLHSAQLAFFRRVELILISDLWSIYHVVWAWAWDGILSIYALTPLRMLSDSQH